MSQFETGILTRDENVEASDRLNAAWVDRAMTRTAHRRVIFDMDSSESPVHGGQEGASYNGHFGSTCYHPLFVFNQFGDCEGAMLRSGNVHSAHRWRDVLDPILSRYGSTGVRRYFRADAAFAKPDIYEYLEERRVFYAIRLPSNKVLQHEIAPLLIRPVGRPPKRPVILYDAFWYRAGSWYRARRVVAKVEWHRGKLFPRVGFIVTNMTAGPEGVVRFYNGRGTAEQWIKEVAPRSAQVESFRCGTRPRVGRWLGEQSRGSEAEPCLKPSRQCGGGHPTTSCAASQSAVTVTKGTADRSVVPTTTRSR